MEGVTKISDRWRLSIFSFSPEGGTLAEKESLKMMTNLSHFLLTLGLFSGNLSIDFV